MGLIEELLADSLHEIDLTNAPCTVDKILKSHSDFVESVGLKLFEEDQGLPYCTGPLGYTKLHANAILLSVQANAQQKQCDAY